jgi:hypothetical protein
MRYAMMIAAMAIAIAMEEINGAMSTMLCESALEEM